MNILMLGNSFTFYCDMPDMLAKLMGEHVESVTRGGSSLFDHLNPHDELGIRTFDALKRGWDYVVLQEYSSGPVVKTQEFFDGCAAFQLLLRGVQAQPVLYATWAYQQGSTKEAASGLPFAKMDTELRANYFEAARRISAPCADVGAAFNAALAAGINPYDFEGYHPSLEGSYLAACVIAKAIAPGKKLNAWVPEGMDEGAAKRIREMV